MEYVFVNITFINKISLKKIDLYLYPVSKNGISEDKKWESISSIIRHELLKDGEIDDVDEWKMDGTAFYVGRESLIDALKKTQEKEKIFKYKFKNKIFDKIIIPDDDKERILEVLSQIKNKDKIFKEWGLGEIIKNGKGLKFLFSGESGTGKTYCGKLIAEYLGIKYQILSGAEILSKWHGESQQNVKRIFSDSNKETLLIIDEADSFFTNRDSLQHLDSQVTNQFLIEMERSEGIIVLTTNRKNIVDTAVSRRLDAIIDFKYPNKEARKKIWKLHIPNKIPQENIDFDKLSEIKCHGGMIKNTILSCARKMLYKNIKKLTTNFLINVLKEEQGEQLKIK